MAFGDKLLYVCKRLGVEKDDYGNEIAYYENAKEYRFSYMPTSSQVDYQLYGTLVDVMFTMYVPYQRMLGVIKVGDLAYLIDNDTQDIESLKNIDNDNIYKPNANYRVKTCQAQNMKIKILFEKINK